MTEQCDPFVKRLCTTVKFMYVCKKESFCQPKMCRWDFKLSVATSVSSSLASGQTCLPVGLNQALRDRGGGAGLDRTGLNCDRAAGIVGSRGRQMAGGFQPAIVLYHLAC